MFELKAWPLFLLSKEYQNFHYNYGMCDKQKEAKRSNKSNAEVESYLLKNECTSIFKHV